MQSTSFLLRSPIHKIARALYFVTKKLDILTDGSLTHKEKRERLNSFHTLAYNHKQDIIRTSLLSIVKGIRQSLKRYRRDK